MGSNPLIFRARRLALAMLATGGVLAATAFAQDAELADEPPVVAPAPEGSVGGMGDINLFPKRVVIDGRRDIATIGLYNRTANEGDYEIRIMDMIMTPDGQLSSFDNGISDADKAKVRTASPFLRYSPRRVTLRGSESQTIRLMARAESDLADGEYRSHFLAISVPRDANAGFSIDDAVGAGNAEGIGVTIRPRFGISIPIIVRIGETTLDVGISDARVLSAPDGTPMIGITLTRSGTRSAFGDVAVTARGASEPIAISRGVGIYPEVGERRIVIPITPETDPRVLAAGAELTVTFTDDDVAPGTRLAEHKFVIR